MAFDAEAIERAAEAALHAAADDATRAALGLRAVEIADALAFMAPALPASAIVANRCIGLGLATPPSPATVAEIVHAYRAAAVARFFLHVHPDVASDRLATWLADAGLVPARGWQKFSRDAAADAALPPVARDVGVREIGAGEGETFARIVTDAFDMGAAAVPWLARLPAAAGWRAFLAEIDGVPAGAGALFVQGAAAWTDFGATVPAHRGRGVQRACLVHRVRTALESGCRRLYSCTGAAVPGDPQHSYANILRCGFREDDVRANWAPAPPA